MAARNINDIYNILLYICRKQRGVFISTSDSDMALDNGQMELFGESFTKEYQINQTVVDCLSPFKVQKQFTSLAENRKHWSASSLY